jgi:hypothetical protein
VKNEITHTLVAKITTQAITELATTSHRLYVKGVGGLNADQLKHVLSDLGSVSSVTMINHVHSRKGLGYGSAAIVALRLDRKLPRTIYYMSNNRKRPITIELARPRVKPAAVQPKVAAPAALAESNFITPPCPLTQERKMAVTIAGAPAVISKVHDPAPVSTSDPALPAAVDNLFTGFPADLSGSLNRMLSNWITPPSPPTQQREKTVTIAGFPTVTSEVDPNSRIPLHNPFSVLQSKTVTISGATAVTSKVDPKSRILLHNPFTALQS